MGLNSGMGKGWRGLIRLRDPVRPSNDRNTIFWARSCQCFSSAEQRVVSLPGNFKIIDIPAGDRLRSLKKEIFFSGQKREREKHFAENFSKTIENKRKGASHEYRAELSISPGYHLGEGESWTIGEDSGEKGPDRYRSRDDEIGLVRKGSGLSPKGRISRSGSSMRSNRRPPFKRS